MELNWFHVSNPLFSTCLLRLLPLTNNSVQSTPPRPSSLLFFYPPPLPPGSLPWVHCVSPGRESSSSCDTADCPAHAPHPWSSGWGQWECAAIVPGAQNHAGQKKTGRKWMSWAVYIYILIADNKDLFGSQTKRWCLLERCRKFKWYSSSQFSVNMKTMIWEHPYNCRTFKLIYCTLKFLKVL